MSSIPGAIKRFEDNAWGMKRIEIVCANCGGHLVLLRFISHANCRDMYSKVKDSDMRMEIRSMNDIVSTVSRSNSTIRKNQQRNRFPSI